MADLGFSKRKESPTLKGEGSPTYYLANFSNSYIKMKKMDRARKGVHAPPKCGIFNYFYFRDMMKNSKIVLLTGLFHDLELTFGSV